MAPARPLFILGRKILMFGSSRRGYAPLFSFEDSNRFSRYACLKSISMYLPDLTAALYSDRNLSRSLTGYDTTDNFFVFCMTSSASSSTLSSVGEDLTPTRVPSHSI